MSTSPISIDSPIFVNIKTKITADMIATINKSPLLVSQLNDYASDILAGRAIAIADSASIGSSGTYTTTVAGKKQIFMDLNEGWAKGQGTWYTDTKGLLHSISPAGDFTSILSHEIGHYKYWDSDRAGQSLIQAGPTELDTRTGYSLYQEGEAAYNNWLVRNEVKSNGGQEVNLHGDNGDEIAKMDSVASANPSLTPAQQMVLLSDSAARIIATHHPSTAPTQTYWDYYRASWISKNPALAPNTPVSSATNVTLQDANHDGIYDEMHVIYADGSEVWDKNNSANDIPFFTNLHTTVNVASNQTAMLSGIGYTVNGGDNSTIWISGNGATSDNTHIITANTRGRAVWMLGDTRANIITSTGTYTAKGGGNYGSYTDIHATDNVNVGVYGTAGRITGGGSGTGIWIGGNGTGRDTSLLAIDNPQAKVVVVDNSYVGVAGNVKDVTVLSNANVVVLDYNKTVYMIGNHSQLEDRALGTVYEQGTNNLVDLRNTATVYNTGTGNMVNAFAPQSHVYSQGNYQYTYIYDSSSTVYITYSTSSQVGAPEEDYYYFWGFGGDKDKVSANISGGDPSISKLFDTAHTQLQKNAAAGAVAQLQSIIKFNEGSTVTGTRLSNTTISWAFDNKPDGHDEQISAKYQKYIAAAFDTWSKATGLNFQESTDAALANVVVNWKNLDTKDTGLLGVTGFSVKNGHIQPHATISLEAPSETALVHGKGGALLYAGTDATLEQVALHEIGHLLGLGTNNDPTSIEYYMLNSDNRAISSSDLNTLYSIYPELGHSPATLVGTSWSLNEQAPHAVTSHIDSMLA